MVINILSQIRLDFTCDQLGVGVDGCHGGGVHSAPVLGQHHLVAPLAKFQCYLFGEQGVAWHDLEWINCLTLMAGCFFTPYPLYVQSTFYINAEY